MDIFSEIEENVLELNNYKDLELELHNNNCIQVNADDVFFLFNFSNKEEPKQIAREIISQLNDYKKLKIKLLMEYPKLELFDDITISKEEKILTVNVSLDPFEDSVSFNFKVQDNNSVDKYSDYILSSLQDEILSFHQDWLREAFADWNLEAMLDCTSTRANIVNENCSNNNSINNISCENEEEAKALKEKLKNFLLKEVQNHDFQSIYQTLSQYNTALTNFYGTNDIYL